MRQSDKLAIFRLIPPKVAITLIVVAILYAFLQPVANQKFGWRLPSIASVLELDFSPDNASTKEPKTAASGKAKEPNAPQLAEESKPVTKVQPTDESANKSTKAESASSKKKPAESSTQAADVSPKKPNSPVEATAKPASDPDLVHGLLKPAGKDRFVSPTGLVYGPGSEEGHRLKHIERHLKDQPSRPGSHGVFEGSMNEFLVAIDDAYVRAKRGAKGTTRRDEDGTIVYEANFTKTLGYLGGTEGKRRKNPDLKRMRVVVSEKGSVITAFPF